MQKTKLATDYPKAFLVSAGAGLVFGVFAGFGLYSQGISSQPRLLFATAVTLATAVTCGCCGLIGAFLESRLARWGMKNPLARLATSFALIAAATVLIIMAGGSLLGGEPFLSELSQYSLLGAGAGISFGAVFALLNYRAETIRQRLQLLEMENRHLADLASREELLREAARNLAVAEERNRMARDLHDSISQGMHGIVYSLRSLRSVLADNPRGQEILGHLNETADDTLKELRRLVLELSPSPLEDHGLEDALRLHCDLFARRQRVELEFAFDYQGQLQPDQEMALYRITQEALTNVQKHADADAVQVALKGGTRTTLIIRDNGKGFETKAIPGGHGLQNMATRARQGGGEFLIEARLGQGTTVTVSYPSPLPATKHPVDFTSH